MGAGGDTTLVLLLQLDRVVCVAPRAAHHAGALRGGVAAIAGCSAVGASRDREMSIVIVGHPHAAQSATKGCCRGGGQRRRVYESGAPGTRDVTLRAILRERPRGGGTPMVGMDVGIEVVIGVTRETVALNRGPLPLAITLMAFGTIRQGMHSGERKSSSPMNLERLHVIPAPRGMTALTACAEPRLVRILVAFAAFAGHSPLPSMTFVAGRRPVSSSQWEARA